MKSVDQELVLVAGELRELSGLDPEWPGGRDTLFNPPGAPLPKRADVVAVIPLVSQSVGPDELDGLPHVGVVANYGVGYDNIDLAAAARRGVVVTNTPDVLTDATADLAMALILAAMRRLGEGFDLARSGDWTGWRPTQLLGFGLREKTLGILGAGRIGVATARRASAFGMDVTYWDRATSDELEADPGARRIADLAEILRTADVVSIHLPLNPETERLLDADRLALMKPDAVLVNTARGAVIDQEAVADALRAGRLSAAGLDVFESEPDIPQSLRELPDCFVLPHLGSATREARQAMWELAAANARSVLEGKEPVTPVPLPSI
jgi:glyoxylate reductase